jgi:hypothetical protein
MVLVGLLGVVVGFTGGSLVALWPWGSGWFEAVGTWFAGLVAASAVTLAFLAYRSEEFARRREHRRQSDAADAAKRDEDDRFLVAADHVKCEAREAVSTPTGTGISVVESLEVEVRNLSDCPITEVSCRIDGLGVTDWSFPLVDTLPPNPQESWRRQFEPPGRLEIHPGSQELYDHAEFFFTQNGVRWSRRFRGAPLRLDSVL